VRLAREAACRRLMVHVVSLELIVIPKRDLDSDATGQLTGRSRELEQWAIDVLPSYLRSVSRRTEAVYTRLTRAARVGRVAGCCSCKNELRLFIQRVVLVQRWLARLPIPRQFAEGLGLAIIRVRRVELGFEFRKIHVQRQDPFLFVVLWH